MRATCLFNSDKQLGIPRTRYWSESRYDLKVGTEYVVYAMALFKWLNRVEAELLILVVDDNGAPRLVPIGLFECYSYVLPFEWEFALCDGISASGRSHLSPHAHEHQWIAMWGYSEFVRNPDHTDLLQDGDPDARAIFFAEVERRRSLSEFYQ